MAKIGGTLICLNCGANINWDYHIPERISPKGYEVETFDPTKVHATQTNSYDSDVLALQIRCPRCSQKHKIACTREDNNL